MKKIIIVLTIIINIQSLFGQHKRIIDSNAFKKWPDLGDATLSIDGKFLFYTIHSNEFNTDTLVVQCTDANWIRKIANAKNPCFSTDGKSVIYQYQSDSLGIQVLGKSLINTFANVSSYLRPTNGIARHLIFQSKKENDQLVILDLKTGNKKTYFSVSNQYLSGDGKAILLEHYYPDNHSYSLDWINLVNGHLTEVYKGNKIDNILIDNKNKQLCFIETNNENNKVLWYYNFNTGKLKVLTTQHSVDAGTNLVLDCAKYFSDDGSRIFLNLKEDFSPIQPKGTQVDIWSYTDTKLQSQQLKEINETKSFLAVIDVSNKKVLRIENENEFSRVVNDEYLLIIQFASDANPSEVQWNRATQRIQYLMSSKTGKRQLLSETKDYDISISTGGNYLAFYNPIEKAYCSIELSSGINRNMTKNIDSKNSMFSNFRRVGGWGTNDGSVFVYDEYDIWRLDPKGIKIPENLTNGYGRKNKIKFYFRIEDRNKIIDFSKELILTGFNTLNKENGFYSIAKDRLADPRLLTKGPYIYDIEGATRGILDIPGRLNYHPLKSLNGQAYIIKRSSAIDHPNYYSTKNFKTFIKLSNIHPEKDFNWYTTELHQWKSGAGDTLQGILYKPEDFNPSTKYPVILYYYDKRSDGLNAYWTPNYLMNGCAINIPYLVSNGYLVVALDIKYKTGEIGQNVSDAITSCAEYFSKESFVNSKKIGVNGFSHGGYETYYLVTRSQIFAAACGGGGITDIISFYGGLKDESYSAQNLGQLSLGNVTLWSRPDLFIENSPIFKADKVTTPLLMMHTSYDGAVPFIQAIEFFTALRSLGKKVWLLEYNEGNHGVWGESEIDYSNRMLQFYDHYLKDKPAPLWMLEGRPARLKGIDDRLQLDTLGRTPGPGLVVPH